MRKLSWMFIAAAIAMATPAHAEEGALPYLFDQLKRPTYRQTIDDLFKDQNPPAWFAHFLGKGDGVATPGAVVLAGGSAYELYAVCKPHNCGGNFVYLLFASEGLKAWALSMVDGKDFRYYGNPNADQRAALTDAAGPEN